MASHAKLSPSSAHEWILCALSVEMKEKYQHLDPNNYSVANAQGTMKHAVIEQCLREDLDPYGFVGMEMRLGDYREDDEDMPQEWADYTYEFTEEDADTIMDALDEIDRYEGVRHIEFRVNLGRWLPGQFGTLDLGIVIEHHDGWVTILIWDNKFGRVPVSPIRNPQMRLYGLGFWDNIVRPEFGKKVREIKFHIFQPTVRGGGGSWKCSLDDLLDFADVIEEAGKKALAKVRKANPGPEQCQYCIGAKLMKCEAYVAYNRKILTSLFSDDEDIEELIEDDEIPCMKIGGVSDKERAWIMDNFPMFKRFVERLEEQAFEQAYIRGGVPGMKLAYGNRPRRKFRSLEKAIPRIEDAIGKEQAYTKKLVSPAQLEKIVGKKRMVEYEDIIDRGEAKLVLVPADDSREGIKSIRDMLMDDED